MNCESFEELMAGLLAGDATREERERVEAHLLDCAACRESFAIAKAGWDGAKAVRVAGLPDEVDRRVVAALQPRSTWEKFFRVGTGIAAGIMLAVALFRSMPAPVEKRPVPAVLAMVRPSALGTLYAVDPETQRPVGELSIQKLSVSVEILDGVAQTTVEQVFFNETDARLEGQFRFPLPPDASITRLAMEIDGKLMEGEVVERQKARQTYEGIVRRMKDPALLEWMPGGMFSCRIFPIEAKQPKRILIGYQQALAGFDGKMQYVYPLVSETTSTREIGTFVFNAVAKGATIVGERSIEATKFHAKKDVVLEVELEAAEATFVTHRDTFNLFLQPKADAIEAARPRAGTVFIVDCSAAMNEPTMEVARRVVEKLIDASPGGTLQVIGFNIAGDFSQATKQSSIEKLFSLKPGGALDFGQAVRTAMAACPDGGEVVFVGGGTPSWGETDVAKIVEGGKAACGTKQVTFRAVAVGSGSDRATLGAVASAFSGGVQAISPSDDVNARLAQIARTAGRAAMTDVKVEFDGQVTEVAPAQLGSLYFGERLLVTGRFTGVSLKAVLTGKVQGRAVRREWTFTPPAEELGNLFVKRLWAQRRLADLMAKGEAAKEEITKLGVACQVMTPYTSFLVLESEKAYEEHAIERKKKEEERLVKGEGGDAAAKSNECYLQSVEWKRRGDLEKATDACQLAIKLWPENLNARKLLGEINSVIVGSSVSEEEWRRLGEQVGQKPSAEEYEQLVATQDWIKIAKSHREAGDAEKARNAAAKAAELAPASAEARQLLAELRAAAPGEPIVEQEVGRFKVQLEQALIEITNHIRNGERYYKIRQYDDAARELEEADFKLKHIPYDVAAMQSLEGPVGDLLRKAKDASILERTRVAATKSAEADAEIRGEVLAKRREADERYQLAERFYRSGDFDRAELEASKALRLHGDHSGARALSSELLFMMGRGSAGWSKLDGDETGGPLKATSAGITGVWGPDVRGTIAPPYDVLTGKYLGEGRSFRLPLAGTAGASSIPQAGEKRWESETDYLKIALDPARTGFDFPGVDIQRVFPGPGYVGFRLSSVDVTTPGFERFTLGAGIDLPTTGFTTIDDATDLHTKKLLGDADVYSRQLGVVAAQTTDLEQKIEDYRQKLARASSNSNTATQELQFARQEIERLSSVIAMLNARGIDTSNAPPLKAMEGKVTACDDSIGMVVLSIGKNDGVLEGNEFTIYRGGKFVAKIDINKVDARWCAGRVTLKKEAPRVGDDASNSIFVTAPAGGSTVAIDTTVREAALAKARLQMNGLDLKAWQSLQLLRSVKAQK